MQNPNRKSGNIKQAVPFFGVTNMKESLDFCLRVLGFDLKISWPDETDIRWCYMEKGGAAMMLQGRAPDTKGELIAKVRSGFDFSVCFFCEDALQIYHEITARGAAASEPFVSNGLWNTEVKDPDGYRLEFESYTKVAEGTRYSELKA